MFVRPFIWKIFRCSTCITTLEIAFRPGYQHKLMNEMSFTRRQYNRNLSPSLSNNSVTFDYDHKKPSNSQGDSYGKPLHVNCGELRVCDANLVVHMKGRVHHQRIKKFLALYDSHGTTQLVIPQENTNLKNRILSVPPGSEIEILGVVHQRPSKTICRTLATGEIDVEITDLLDYVSPKRKLSEIDDDEEDSRPASKRFQCLKPMTSGELVRCESSESKQIYQTRTHVISELGESDCGISVTICGWVMKIEKNRFLNLQDGYGIIQLVIPTSAVSNYPVNEIQLNETLIRVIGVVQLKPNQNAFRKTGTGQVELLVTDLEIIGSIEQTSQQEKLNELNVQQSDQHSSAVPSDNINKYCVRTHTCGELQKKDIHKEVVLYGWLAFSRNDKFLIIRDGYGITQVVVPKNLTKEIKNTPHESVIMVRGTVCARPPNQIRTYVGKCTGEIEIILKEFKVLNPAKTNMPFIIRDHHKPKESIRMKYRYLDLRFDEMQFNLRLRSKILMKMREFLINHRGFVEVETPTLFRRTPGGAQEFIVPTRTEGKFYSLVQSPQQLKQLLMIGSMDRYFQVARCYRDEGARPDRQPEFTQMDIELSFTNRELIMALIEDLLKAGLSQDFYVQTPFPVIKYHEAMHWYGTDKPDISFDKKIIDISELVEEKKNFLPEDLQDISSFTAKVLVFDSNREVQLKLKTIIQDCEDVKKMKGDNKAKLIRIKCTDDWEQVIEEDLPFVNANKLKDTINLPIPSTIVVGIGPESQILPLMGKIRNDMFQKQSSALHFAWIVDFPLFLQGDDGLPEAAHHPFTQPYEEDVDLLKSDPYKVRGLHFDLVLNGYEVGGGSVRIHDPKLQVEVLRDILKIPTNSLQHLLEALACGAPPHGGIALGIDRLLAILVNANSIREVIAFPKGVDGKDPMCGAPCTISDKEKKLYHLIPRSP